MMTRYTDKNKLTLTETAWPPSGPNIPSSAMYATELNFQAILHQRPACK